MLQMMKHCCRTIFLISLTFAAHAQEGQRYEDQVFRFAFEQPDWLTLAPSGNAFFLAGSFTDQKGHGTAKVNFKITPRYKVESYEAFCQFIIESTQVGEHPAWSARHTLLSKTPLEPVGQWRAYEVQTRYRGEPHHYAYVLAETPAAYLWVTFAPQPDGYQSGLPRFLALMETLEALPEPDDETADKP